MKTITYGLFAAFCIAGVRCADDKNATTTAIIVPKPQAQVTDQQKQAIYNNGIAMLDKFKSTIADKDMSNHLASDIAASPVMDNQVKSNITKMLQSAQNDPKALNFIFTQALEGNLLTMLKNNADLAQQMKDKAAVDVKVGTNIDPKDNTAVSK